MPISLSPFAERSLTVVAAAFKRRADAQSASRALSDGHQIAGQVQLVAPNATGQGLGRKFEPESQGIWRTALRSHLLLGIAGLVLGLTVAAALILAGWPPAARSPYYALSVAGGMGAFMGMMIAGLLTLRPDHGAVVDAVRPKVEEGEWAVIVRPEDAKSASRAVDALREKGGETYRSL